MVSIHPAYGSGKGHTKQQYRTWINELARDGYLEKTGDQYPVIRPGPKSLSSGTVRILLTAPVGGAVPRKVSPRPDAAVSTGDSALFMALKALRKSIAETAGIPPYMVFADKSLVEMARVRPQDRESFGTISGVGEHKLNKYGPAFIEEIHAFCEIHR